MRKLLNDLLGANPIALALLALGLAAALTLVTLTR